MKFFLARLPRYSDCKKSTFFSLRLASVDFGFFGVVAGVESWIVIVPLFEKF